MNEFEGVDMDAVVQGVIDDMGEAAHQYKAKRYAPKPKPEEAAPPPEAAAAEEPMPSASELESLLGH